jgi:hypothetical protein
MTTDEIAQSLKNIEKHLETLVRFNYAQIKKQAFANEAEEQVFEMTGVKGQKEICSELHISPNKLSDLWNKWLNMGLLVKDGTSYKKTVE